MKLLDLFSGIGGFALAFRTVWPDGEIAAFCEKDKYCQQVLLKRFERSVIDDIENIKENLWGEIDILTGGFPCQPFSLSGANKRRGTEDDRWLWPEMFRVIRLVKPRWVVAENVYGLVAYKDGMVFEQVCTDLEGEGYEVGAFVIPACAINAPHRRDRVWIVGHAERSGCDGFKRRRAKQEPADGCADVADGAGLCKTQPGKKRRRRSGDGNSEVAAADPDGSGFEKQLRPVANAPELHTLERSGRWASEPGIRRVAYGIPRRVDRLRALGNAIVPQVAAVIFKAIKETDRVLSYK